MTTKTPYTPEATRANWMEYHTGYEFPYCSIDFRNNPNPDASEFWTHVISDNDEPFMVYHPCCGLL